MQKEEPFIAEAEVTSVIRIMRDQYAFDLSGYSHTSLRRRFARIFKLFEISGSRDFELFLKRKQENFNRVVEEFTVNTTEMFRDPEFWSYIRPVLIQLAAKVPTIRIWHAGCSSGEEVYSMLILLQEAGIIQQARLIATDINSEVLRRAAAGMISGKNIEQHKLNFINAGCPGSFCEHFGEEANGYYQLNKELLRYVMFRKHNLVNGNAFSRFDLILCRNVMIYFEQDLQSRVIKLFSDSLYNGGLLALGSKETLNYIPNNELYDSYCTGQRVFRKK